MAPLILLPLALIQSGQSPSIKLDGGAFVLEQGDRRVTVPLKRGDPPKTTAVVYREDDAFAVWDTGRGLSIRKGKSVTSTLLPGLPVSPRLFDKAQIEANRARLESGELRASASGLAGSAQIGTVAYFLVQWRDKKEEPWLEALIKVDLADAKPIPELVGRFDGFSVARSSIAEELAESDGALMLVARQGDTWGIGRYDPKPRAFSFEFAGSRLLRSTNVAPRTVLVEERMSYGTTLLARVFLPNGTRRNLLEVRGSVDLIDRNDPLLAIVGDGKGLALRNLDSGAELRLSGKSRVDRTEFGVIVSSPESNPTSALLYDPSRWERVALWSAGPKVSGGGSGS